MNNSKYLKIVYKNKEARSFFGLYKSLFFRSIGSTDLFSSSKITLLDSKDPVLYIVFDKSITRDGKQIYLLKIDLKNNKMETVALHRYSSDESRNLKFAHESVMYNYMIKHDRNISGRIGNTEYI